MRGDCPVGCFPGKMTKKNALCPLRTRGSCTRRGFSEKPGQKAIENPPKWGRCVLCARVESPEQVLFVKNPPKNAQKERAARSCARGKSSKRVLFVKNPPKNAQKGRAARSCARTRDCSDGYFPGKAAKKTSYVLCTRGGGDRPGGSFLKKIDRKTVKKHLNTIEMPLRIRKNRQKPS